jgi:hypothetical protein
MIAKQLDPNGRALKRSTRPKQRQVELKVLKEVGVKVF